MIVKEFFKERTDGVKLYRCLQDHTSQETWIPFTAGTESLYGARPKMNSDGTFDYVYNMAAEVGMRVNHEGKTYECIQAIGDMLFPPSEIPAHFMEVDA